MSQNYDKDLINREVVAICDHYLTERRGEGKRQTYLCPACGDRNFEVDPERGYAGCFDAECEAPTTTDALGMIAYFEGKDLSGEGFVMCLKKGYEILGLLDPEEEKGAARTSTNGNRQKAMTPRKDRASSHEKAMTPRSDRRGNEEGVSEDGDASVHSSGPQWGAATSSPPEASEAALLERPIQAWQENEDGTRTPVAAVVMRDPEQNATEDGGGELEDAELADRTERRKDRTDERRTAHEVFEELLKLCRREERDESFLLGRGLDKQTIEEGRFGSISKSRCNYVLNKLRQKFSEEELLCVPGFRKAENGQLRFSLYGDYALLPYHDRDGYIRTVEGRFTGEEMGKYDKRYKALLNSAVHLYVHPRYKPDEVVAICEGAIGAMVAARYGFAVASIKGYRNYRRRVDGDGAAYTILPEFEGVDFAGKVIVYIPDLDVKPQTREEAFSLVPEACQWMIQRQGGVPKVAMLPEGAKDLDAWILSLDEEEREQKIEELLSGALPLEQWKQRYLEQDPSAVGFADRSGEGQTGQPGGQHGEFGESGSPSVTNNSGEEDSGFKEPEDDQGKNRSSRKRRVFGDPDGDSVPPANNGGLSEGSDSGAEQQPLEGFTEMQGDDEVDSQGQGSTDNTGQSQPASSRREYGEDSEQGSAAQKDDTSDAQGRGGDQREQGGEGSSEKTEKGDRSEENGTSSDEPPGGAEEKNQVEDDTAEMEAVSDEPEHEPTVAAFEVSTKGEWSLTTLAYVTATVLLTILIYLFTSRYLGWLESPLWWDAVLAAFIGIWVTAGFRKLRKGSKAKSLRRHIEGPNV